MANELTLVGMSDMYTKIGRPGVADKERVWLAVDHTVDPRNYAEAKPAALIKLSEDFAAETGITDFWRPNTTIMHTEFARQRAQPGQIVIGADSHTCSAGGMGALAIGLGAGDVVLPLVTGQTWLQVPETLLVEFVGEPAFGVGGKDIILHVLGLLKRGTVANDRAVEWRGPGLRFMSADARFAVANMTTEFGGLAGVFEADEVTARALAGRAGGPGAAHAADALYFRADEGAAYADRYTVDLSTIVPQVALFPSPDNCRPAADLAAEGMRIDGAFIGACTTTQEDLILGALVLEEAKRVFKPEFLNRISDIVFFRPLDKNDLIKIVEIEITKFAKRLVERKITLEFSAEAKSLLIDKGYDEKYGARPLRRAVEHYVEDPLAEALLRGDVKEGEAVLVERDGEKLTFKQKTPPAATEVKP